MDTNTLTSDAVGHCNLIRKAAYDITKDAQLMLTNVPQCITLMNANSDDVDVQNSGILAIGALCEERQLEELIGERGGIEVILVSLHRFLEYEAAVKNALVVLRSLFRSIANRERFCIHGGVKLVVRAMSAHYEHPSIQRVACALISTLSFESDRRRTTVTSSGVVPLIVRCLYRFDAPEDVRLQTHACLAMRNLSSHPVDCEHILNVDPLLASVCHVTSEAEDPGALFEALNVLRNVISHRDCIPLSPDLERNIVSATVSVSERTLIAYRKYRKPEEAALSLLRSCLLREDPELSEERSQRIIRLCLSLAFAYMQDWETQDHEIIGHACACVRMLLFQLNLRGYFQKMSNSIETLVHAVKALTYRPIRVEHALLALGNAVFDSQEAQWRVAEADGLQVVRTAMRTNNFSAMVSIAGLEAIHGICTGNSVNVEQATFLSLHSLCVETIRAFKDNPNVLESGLATLVTLGLTPSGIHALRCSRALNAAQHACKQFPYAKKILLLTSRLNSLVDTDLDTFGRQRGSQDRTGVLQVALKLLRKVPSKSGRHPEDR